jgi:cleavage and polyadenylation specificity factor subunit 5
MSETVLLYNISNYSIGEKDPQHEPVETVSQKMNKLEEEYKIQGQRITVEGVLLCHDKDHPHVLLLSVPTGGYYTLPGGTLNPGEDEVKGLGDILKIKLAPIGTESELKWEIGGLLGTWFRPNFEKDMVLFTNKVSILSRTHKASQGNS